MFLWCGIGLVAIAAGLAALLYARWREASLYEDAPACGPDEAARVDTSRCRLLTEATYRRYECPNQQRRTTCELAFDVPARGGTEVRWALLNTSLLSKFHPGDRHRIELFQGSITQVAVDGDALRQVRATPVEAVKHLAIVIPISLLVGLVLIFGYRRYRADAGAI